MMIRTIAVLTACLFAAPAFAADYKLTGENTTIGFTGFKKDGKHVGGFKTVTGKAACDKDVTSLTLEVEIDCSSLFSDDEKLTAHLKGDDFFGVKANPKATVKITKVQTIRTGTVLTGELTLLGKTKEVSFPATVTTGDTLDIVAEFKIKRSDWGMTYGKDKIDDEVQIKVKVAAKK